jgi:hypothetical protein
MTISMLVQSVNLAMALINANSAQVLSDLAVF